MLENDITDVLDLTFTAESDFFGKTEVVELVPGGRDIRVTEANKREYVNLIARHRMTTSIKAQIQVGCGRGGGEGVLCGRATGCGGGGELS
jgi:E3 ubiquitin-protein ligase HUWE1